MYEELKRSLGEANLSRCPRGPQDNDVVEVLIYDMPKLL